MRTIPANGFEIGWPQGWEDHSTVTMIGPARLTFSPNIQVNREEKPSDTPLTDYLNEQRAEIATLEGFQLIESGDRLLAGKNALYHAYTWKIPQGVVIRQMQIVVLHGPTLLTFTCSCMEHDWSTFEPMFEMALAGVKFTG